VGVMVIPSRAGGVEGEGEGTRRGRATRGKTRGFKEGDVEGVERGPINSKRCSRITAPLSHFFVFQVGGRLQGRNGSSGTVRSYIPCVPCVPSRKALPIGHVELCYPHKFVPTQSV
jgi:hypothetical protein